MDSATGLYAPTDAVLEMNCARSEIAAVAASSTSSNASTKSQTTSDDHSDDSREQSLGMLASMIADRVDLEHIEYPEDDQLAIRAEAIRAKRTL